jgi:hypothetical protein
MSFPNDRTYTFDVNNQISDNAAAYTASGWLTVGGAQGIVDVGGNQGTTPLQQARIDAVLCLDVTAITVSGTQTYQFDVYVSNDPGFGLGNVQAAGGIQLGVGTSLRNANSLTSVIGRYELMFSTNVAGSIYEYVSVYLTAANSPSISVEAFVAVLPEV